MSPHGGVWGRAMHQMDALIHGIEVYTTCKSTWFSDMFAEQTIKIVSRN
jgi:alcohol dehydrogenase class IV